MATETTATDLWTEPQYYPAIHTMQVMAGNFGHTWGRDSVAESLREAHPMLLISPAEIDAHVRSVCTAGVVGWGITSPAPCYHPWGQEYGVGMAHTTAGGGQSWCVAQNYRGVEIRATISRRSHNGEYDALTAVVQVNVVDQDNDLYSDRDPAGLPLGMIPMMWDKNEGPIAIDVACSNLEIGGEFHERHVFMLIRNLKMLLNAAVDGVVKYGDLPGDSELVPEWESLAESAIARSLDGVYREAMESPLRRCDVAVANEKSQKIRDKIRELEAELEAEHVWNAIEPLIPDESSVWADHEAALIEAENLR